MMSALGTYIIAFFGYGITIVFGIGTLICVRDYVQAKSTEDRQHEMLNVVVGSALTIFLAAVTRGLVGGL